MRPDSALCPDDIKYDVQQYLLVGQPPGNFLFQVLANNLREAIAGADENNLEALVHIVAYLHNYIPHFAWGTPDRVHSIVACGGVNGYLQELQKQQANEIHQQE